MAKAVLVLDMPDGCGNCPLDDGEYEVCNGIVRDDWPVSEVEKYNCQYYRDPRRPDWCPLISEPTRLTGMLNDTENDAYICGWNACIDALEGKT